MSVDEVKTKICSKCGEEKPATSEYFNKDKRNKDGLDGQCRSCKKLYKAEYYKNNKEKLAGISKKYREENPEKIKALKKVYKNENKDVIAEKEKQYYLENKDAIVERVKDYYQNNKDEILNYQKKYREENPEKIKTYKKYNESKIKEQMKEYRKINKERINETQKKWREKNIEKARASLRLSTQRRKALKGNLPATLTSNQWVEIKNNFNNTCAYCGKELPLEQEHFTPLSKGGHYTKENIIPACKSCNSSKNAKDFFEWYPKQDFYSQERELFIIEHLISQQEEQEVSA